MSENPQHRFFNIYAWSVNLTWSRNDDASCMYFLGFSCTQPLKPECSFFFLFWLSKTKAESCTACYQPLSLVWHLGLRLMWTSPLMTSNIICCTCSQVISSLQGWWLIPNPLTFTLMDNLESPVHLHTDTRRMLVVSLGYIWECWRESVNVFLHQN